MSISAVGSGPVWQGNVARIRQDFQNLSKSLDTGDLDGAKEAFSDLKSISGGKAATPTLQEDWAALGHDLNTGDLSQAQVDFVQLQTDRKAEWSGRHTEP
jgi:hypothetical protein